MLPVAVDAMGGDRAPDEIVAGAVQAAEELSVPVVLVGRPEDLGDTGGLEVIPASEVIAMDADPGKSVRRMKDSSLVRAAEELSAGNTGATMGSALLRMGRIKGVNRPAIATPIPAPGHDLPTVMLDAGANAECGPEMLVQFALMGAVFARRRYGIKTPRVALLSIGEEPTKGSPLVKETHALLAAGAVEAVGATFVGNVEGRDLMGDDADVVVTDGFTGNVALKTLEGGLKSIVGAIYEVFGSTEETKAAADVLLPALIPLAEQLDPDTTGGAMLLGVDGVCIISHGSSSARAVVNAVKVAAEMVQVDLVGGLTAAIRPPE
jgi:glycerol-3-phosphate acyltransferase PlsX